MHRLARAVLVLVIVTGFASRPASSDTLSDGYISGQVTVTTGEPIAGAAVLATSAETGFESRVRTDGRGAFRFPVLRPGQYTLRASSDGFEDSILQNVYVTVGAGTHVIIAVQSAAGDARIDEIEVLASSVSKIDLFSSESALTLNEAKIDVLPLALDTTAVAMLAPGTVAGDGFFDNQGPSGHYASFGGSSVAENAYYVNGMNITNFRNYLGSSTVPFEFFQEFQLKYSGISAEFGRATGGFLNALTKRGTDEFKYGARLVYQSADWSASTPDVISDAGAPASIGSLSERVLVDGFIYASGPVVKDKLFFYALYNPRDYEDRSARSSYFVVKTDDSFWGLKLDYEINADHVLELTGFSDEQDYISTRFNVDPASKTIQENRGDTIFSRGGENWILKYSGNLGESLTVSALFGASDADRTQSSEGDEFPVIFDNRAPEFFTALGSWVSLYQSQDYDERRLARVDIEWRLGRHLLRAGLDREANTSFSQSRFSGGIGYIYWDATEGDQLPVGTVPAGATQVAQQRAYSSGGKFNIRTSSWYMEDSWQVSDDVTLNIGLRNETFDNRNANNETFIKMTDQWAPRVGAAWNVFGNGTARLYGSYGRYYLPVSAVANIFLGGSQYAADAWFVLDGLNADDTPQLGPQIGSTIVFNDREIRDPDSLVDKTIEPMYQDEYTIGFEKEFGEKYVAGVSAIRRVLESTMEDIVIDGALNEYAQENGYTDFVASGLDNYILTNPGTDLRVRIDLDFDGVPETIDLTAESLGFPLAERKYSAVNLFAERVWDGDFFGRVDYTWSKSYGNYEGYVRSDNGQSAAGFTTNFDIPSLMEGSYGDLPNDRRHSVKLYGAWQFRPGWTVSGNARWTTGKPRNTFSLHPTDFLGSLYGSESFYTIDGEPARRGSGGRTSSVTTLDLSLEYEREVFGSGRMVLQLDVFNVFNRDTVTSFWEQTQLGSGLPDTTYGLPREFQAPRSVQLSARLDF